MKRFGLPSILLMVLVTVALFVLSKTNLKDSFTKPFLFLGQLSALLGTTLMSLNFVLSTRWKVIEKIFGGLDRVYKTHQTLGAISFILVLNHPLFLILNQLPNVKAASQYVLPSSNMSYNLGIAALAIFIILVCLTLLVDLPYNLWEKTHEYLGLVIILGTLHVFGVQSDTSRYLPLRAWVLSLTSLGVWAYLYKKYFYGVIGPKYEYSVKDLKRIGDLIQVDLAPLGRQMSFRAGQFAFLNLPKSKNPKEEHPFSIVSAPSEINLRFGAKIVGDYTLNLKDIRVGDPAVVFGPYGAFGERFCSHKNAVCIAGGIGITPFLSMLAQEKHKPDPLRSIHLIYSARTIEDAHYDQEICKLVSDCPNVTYQPHSSRTHGRLTASLVGQLAGDMKKALIFLCGPPSMMFSLRDQFVQLGVRKKNIIFEDFSLK